MIVFDNFNAGPKRFVGQMAFKFVNLGEMGVTKFMPEMADSESTVFGMVAEVVENQVSFFFICTKDTTKIV